MQTVKCDSARGAMPKAGLGQGKAEMECGNLRQHCVRMRINRHNPYRIPARARKIRCRASQPSQASLATFFFENRGKSEIQSNQPRHRHQAILARGGGRSPKNGILGPGSLAIIGQKSCDSHKRRKRPETKRSHPSWSILAEAK